MFTVNMRFFREILQWGDPNFRTGPKKGLGPLGVKESKTTTFWNYNILSASEVNEETSSSRTMYVHHLYFII
jgi:hypothetical protein